MIAIIKFFGGSLNYFSGSFSNKHSWNLNILIEVRENRRSRCQARNIHSWQNSFAAGDSGIWPSIIGSSCSSNCRCVPPKNSIDLSYLEDTAGKDALVSQKNGDDFRRWLSPSYCDIEGQLDLLQMNQKRDVLSWALTMTAFKRSRTSESGFEENLLWIRGPPLVGKPPQLRCSLRS